MLYVVTIGNSNHVLANSNEEKTDMCAMSRAFSFQLHSCRTSIKLTQKFQSNDFDWEYSLKVLAFNLRINSGSTRATSGEHESRNTLHSVLMFLLNCIYWYFLTIRKWSFTCVGVRNVHSKTINEQNISALFATVLLKINKATLTVDVNFTHRNAHVAQDVDDKVFSSFKLILGLSLSQIHI